VGSEWSAVSGLEWLLTIHHSYVKELAARNLNFFEPAVFMFITLLFHKTIFLLSQIGQTPISSQHQPLQFFIKLLRQKA
jgi:hypothetical protein